MGILTACLAFGKRLPRITNTRQVFEKTDKAISVLLAINPSVEGLFVSAFEKNRVFRSLISRMERQLLLPLASPTF
jgi:hypothetical protein